MAEIPSKNPLAAVQERRKKCLAMNKEEIPEPLPQLKELKVIQNLLTITIKYIRSKSFQRKCLCENKFFFTQESKGMRQ